MIVEDHLLVREGLTFVMHQNFPDAKVHAAGDAEEAFVILKNKHIDLVLLDIGLPDISGIEIVDQIIKEYPAIKLLVVTQHTGDALVRHLFDKGAHGFFVKTNSPLEMAVAVATVLNGEQYLSAELKHNLLKTEKAPSIVFSQRETQVLIMLTQGKTSEEIAQRLGIKKSSVESIRERMLGKTATRNSAQLISFAYENAILYS